MTDELELLDVDELVRRPTVEPRRAVVPIGPGAESVRVLLWAADPLAGRWDRSTWDGATWGALDWQSVGCEVGEASYRWGAGQESGILSAAEAGSLDLSTIDPDRALDPLNTASPFYGYVRPGQPLRIVGLAPPPTELVACTAFIDSASYDLASGRGKIRAVDGIAYLAQAQLPDGAALPNTLRARVRAIVAAAGLGALVPVEPEAATDPDVDPAVTPHDGKSAPAWAVISNAAEDALVYVWVDPTGTLRFRSWGAFPPAAFAGIGCPPADAEPGELWLEGIATLETTASADAIRNSIRAYSSGTTWAPAVVDGVSIGRYGPRPYDVDRVVPDRATWASRILADRADAGLELRVGELRPYDVAELAALLEVDGEPSIVRIRDDAHGEVIDLDLGLIGATVGITPAGWRWAMVTMLSRIEWEDIAPKPPDPPDPPDPGRPWHTETRTYIANRDTLLTLTSGGAKYGAGASDTLPVGAWSGWTYRAVIGFPTIPWSNVRAITAARLNVRTTSQDRVGFGSSPKLKLRRITSSWSEGSLSSPGSGNATVWPGPSTTSSGENTDTLPTSENAETDLACLAIVRAWAPTSIGGSGAAQHGIRLAEYSSSQSYTTEIYPREAGTTGARPTLELDLEVYD